MVMDEEISKIKLEIIRNCDAALTEKLLDLIEYYKREVERWKDEANKWQNEFCKVIEEL